MSDEKMMELKGGTPAWSVRAGRSWVAVAIRGEEIVFTGELGQEALVPLAEVSSVAGGMGLVWFHGWTMGWKRLAVCMKDGRRFSVRFDPPTNEALYRKLVEVCPQALGISADGSVAVGALPATGTVEEWSEQMAQAVRREFSRQGLALLWLAGLMAAMGLVTLLFLRVVIGLALFLVSAVALGTAVMKAGRGIRVSRRIQATRRGRPLDEQVLENREPTPLDANKISPAFLVAILISLLLLGLGMVIFLLLAG
jgi:hypothetical protein